MALTYQQDPKKYNPTVRLKRIAQRFSPGYKSIRVLKEDYLGRISSKISLKKSVQLPTRYLGFRTDYVRPGKKWRSWIPKSASRLSFAPSLENLRQSFIAVQEVQQQSVKGVLLDSSIFRMRDARKKPLLTPFQHVSPVPRLFTMFFKQFHLPYDFLRTLKSTLLKKRIHAIEAIRSKEKHLTKEISKAKYNLARLLASLKRGFRHRLPWKNVPRIAEERRLDCITKIKSLQARLSLLYRELALFLRTQKFIGPNKSDITSTQVPFYMYGVHTPFSNRPDQFVRFPQEHVVGVSGFALKLATYYNLKKLDAGKLFRFRSNIRLCQVASLFFHNLPLRDAFISNKHVSHDSFQLQQKNLARTDRALFEKLYGSVWMAKKKGVQLASAFNKFDHFFGRLRKRIYLSRMAFNIFNFNTKSNQVLYRYMEILKQRFGIYSVDIPFRIDNYAKAYQKKRRPSKYKRMMIARAKIRLFYGQLTVEKMGRVLKKGKATFPHMFGLMERRLDVMLVRTNFAKNIFAAQHIVRAGHILVNNRVHRNCFYAIKCFDFVTFKSKQFEQYCKYLLLTKLRLNKFVYPAIPYLVVNYRLMYFFATPVTDARKQVGFTAPLTHSFLSRY